MLSVAEAVASLQAASHVLARIVTADVNTALGRVLARDIVSGIDVPPADNSAMDGYAFRHGDVSGNGEPLQVSQRIAAGMPPKPLVAGTAARIFTGAEVPPGADTVVMQEHCEPRNGEVVIDRLPTQGANIRRRAQDIRAGLTVLKAGVRLSPQALGLIASLGQAQFSVYRPLRVAVISNGDELVEPGKEAGPGQIFNSNRYMLAALMRAWGFETLDFGIAPDDPHTIRDMLERAAREADVIVSSGGVSVGDEDHIKNVVAELGGIDLWKVSIKPGKPFAFGHVGGTPFLGLPGNPSSVLVTCLVIARPYLLACQGLAQTQVQPIMLPALFESPPVGRETYLRARSAPDGVECYPRQSSGILLSTVWGNGLAVQRAGQAIAKGDMIEFIPYAVFY